MGNVNSAGDIQTSGVVNNTEVKGQNIKNATGSSDAPNPQSEVDTKSISGRDAIANASPEAQVMVMNELITQVKEGKYVTSLSFWDNFCAWIESIFTNHDRVEILLDKFFDAIFDNKEEFYSELVKQLPGDENLQKVAGIIIQKDPRGLSGAIAARCNELHNDPQELNQLIESHYKIVDKKFSGFKKAVDDIKNGTVPNKKDLQPIIAAQNKGYITEKQFNEINNKLISNIEYTVLTTNEQDKLNSIFKDFKGTNPGDNSLDYFWSSLNGFLQESQLSENDLPMPIISENDLRQFTTFYHEALNEFKKNEEGSVEWGDVFEKLQAKILEDDSLCECFSKQKSANVAACLSIMTLSYAIDDIQTMIAFDDLADVGAKIWDTKHKNDNIEQPNDVNNVPEGNVN